MENNDNIEKQETDSKEVNSGEQTQLSPKVLK